MHCWLIVLSVSTDKGYLNFFGNSMEFITDVKRIGLSDKETAVYIAVLELGPSTVQAIARRARVARSTTYIVLEALIVRGLTEQRKVGKKTIFVAEPPNHLLDFIKTEEDVLHKKRAEVESLVPKLQALMRTVAEKPTVEYYAGLDGLRAMRQQMLRQSHNGDVWYNISNVDALIRVFGAQESLFFKLRRAKGITAQTIFTTKSAKLKKELFQESVSHATTRKYIAPEKFTSDSGLTIYDNHVAVGNYGGELGGIIVEAPAMSKLMREVFELLWEKIA